MLKPWTVLDFGSRPGDLKLLRLRGGDRARSMDHSLGLRSQLIITLSAAFILAFSLLAFAVLRLEQRQQRKLVHQEADRWAHTVALFSDVDDESAMEKRIHELAQEEGLQGAVVELSKGGRLKAGELSGPPEATLKTEEGTKIQIWVAPNEGISAALPMLSYGVLTGIALLFLLYVLLTRMIVQPVANIRAASERLASGKLQTNVPVQGAAEVAELAVSFNRMAKQLREDRETLVDRLALLEATTQELQTAEDQVIRTSRLAAVGQLAAGIAHEIGNPLAALQGLLELVESDECTVDEKNEYVARAQKEGARIQRTIRDLLDFAREEPRLDSAALASADLHEVLQNTIQLVSPQKKFDQIDIRLDLQDALPRVCGSADQLRQLVLNLFLNAADAMQGRGRIDIATRLSPDGLIYLSIRDSGPGIADDVVGKIFDPFVTTKLSGHGTGLGLAVCHAIVDRVGGQITAVNTNEGGACFEIRIPASSQ